MLIVSNNNRNSIVSLIKEKDLNGLSVLFGGAGGIETTSEEGHTNSSTA